jgi:hypothetical protein
VEWFKEGVRLPLPPLNFKTPTSMYKELIDLLEEQNAWFFGDAKPCKIYINQAYREGVVVVGDKVDNYNVAYVMPNGRMYVKKVSTKEAESILQIDLKNSINNGGITSPAFGF